MSSIASLHVLKTSDLPAITGAPDAWEAVHRLGRELDEEYNWSGHVMLNVLDHLDTLDISLEAPNLPEASTALNATLGDTTLIASSAKAFLDRLDPAAHNPADLLDGPIELDLDDEEARYALEETLTVLRDTIARLADDEVLLLHIG